MRDSFK